MRNPITKSDLTARTRGKGGTIITIRPDTHSARYGIGPFVVKDLFQRKTYDRPGEIAVGPEDRGIAWGIRLEDIDAIVR